MFYITENDPKIDCLEVMNLEECTPAGRNVLQEPLGKIEVAVFIHPAL